jgi:hypothetical protein
MSSLSLCSILVLLQRLDQGVMAYSYKGTSLLQAGAFEAISYLHPILMFVSKAEAYPCGTFQPCLKD